MKVTVISIVIDAPETIHKGLVKRLKNLKIRGQLETIKTTVLLRSARTHGKSPGELRRLVVT